MSKMLLSIPDGVAKQFKAMVPVRKRSRFLTDILQKALKEQEDILYRVAKMVEEDDMLNQDMQAWEVTLEDGLEDTGWETKKPSKPKKLKNSTNTPKGGFNAPQ